MLLGGIVICNQAGGLACGRVRHVPGELAAAHQLELTSFASPTLLWPPSTPPPRSRRAARATRRSLRRARVVVVQVEGAFAARPLDITVVRLTVVVDLLHLRVQQDLASARACVTVAMDGRRLRGRLRRVRGLRRPLGADGLVLEYGPSLRKHVDANFQDDGYTTWRGYVLSYMYRTTGTVQGTSRASSSCGPRSTRWLKKLMPRGSTLSDPAGHTGSIVRTSTATRVCRDDGNRACPRMAGGTASRLSTSCRGRRRNLR